MLTDIEIAQSVPPRPITEIAATAAMLSAAAMRLRDRAATQVNPCRSKEGSPATKMEESLLQNPAVDRVFRDPCFFSTA